MDYPKNLTAADRRWLDLITQCRTSGKSDSQWLKENNIKSPTFYYHVKKLRDKACDVLQPNHMVMNEIQEVVPLPLDVEPVLPTLQTPKLVGSDAVAMRLSVQGVVIEITNQATKEVIQNTIAALQMLC
ncbi:MAG: IS66 family insertion sequence element accessory protein TnpB [Eubacteriales bacterium]